MVRLILCSFLYCGLFFSQIVGPGTGGGGVTPSGTSLPASCTAGQLFILTSASSGSQVYVGVGSSPCVWTAQAGVPSGATPLTGTVTGLCSSDNNQRYYVVNGQASGFSYSIPPFPSSNCSVLFQNNDTANALTLTNASAQTINGQTSGVSVAPCSSPTKGCPVMQLTADLTNGVWIFGNPTTPGAGYYGTTSTSLTIGTGSKSFTTQSGMAYVAGGPIQLIPSGNTAYSMSGTVSSYSSTGTAMTITVTTTVGSGTFSSWTLVGSGPPGANGAAGSNGAISLVQVNTASQTVQPTLNLKAGTNVTITGSNNTGNTSTDVTISASGSLPPSATVGSLLVANGSLSANAFLGTNKQFCAAGKLVSWPVSGSLYSPSISAISTTTAPSISAPLNCLAGGTTASPPTGVNGVIVPPGTTAGTSVTDSVTLDYWHVAPFQQIGIFNYNSAGTTMGYVSAAFIADSGVTPTILGTAAQTSTTASSTQYWPLGGGSPISSELPAAVAIPFAYTLQNLTGCASTTPTNTVSVSVRVNGAAVGTPSSIGFTFPASSNLCSGYDGTNTYTGSAGDYTDIQTISGATTQTVINWLSYGVYPTSGAPEMIWGGINGTASTTLEYSTAGQSGAFGTTFNNQAVVAPRGCTASKLYAVQAVANASGVTTTLTLYKNGSATALTGTITNGSGTGSVLLDGTDTVTFSQGDRFAMAYSTASGTSGTIASWSCLCQ